MSRGQHGRRAPRRGRLAALLAAAAAVAGLLAGCGGSDSSGSESNGLAAAPAAEVGSRSLDALRAAGSVHVIGRLTSTSNGDDISWDLVMAGDRTRGTFTDNSHRLEVIRVGQDTYIQGDRAYYVDIGESDAADLLADTWVRLTPQQADQYRFLTIDGLALSLGEYLAAMTGSVTSAELDGQAAVQASGGGIVLYAAERGDPLPLLIELSGTDNGRIEFTEYGSSLEVEAPAEWVDLAQLG
ncbi:MAG: hypothetical protein IRZ08_10970 [Frankia sp.]|nr:hypothetical protein [Frankia sp.]